MLTSASIEPDVNGFGRYRAVTCKLFHAKTTDFHQLNVCKRVPFHLGMHYSCRDIYIYISGQTFSKSVADTDM